MVEEMPENADTSDNLLALIDQTQQCLVLLNNAECMFYSGLICLHAMSLSVCLCVSVCCVAFSSLQFFKHGFFFKGSIGETFFWTLIDTFWCIKIFCTFFRIFTIYKQGDIHVPPWQHVVSLFILCHFSCQNTCKFRFPNILNSNYMFGYNRNVIFCIFITHIPTVHTRSFRNSAVAWVKKIW